MRRSSGRIVVAAAIAAALALAPAMGAAAASDGSSASTIYSLTNSERGKRDLPKLKRNSALDKVAAAWAKKMSSTANGKCVIGSKGLRHNPSVKSQVPKGWKKVGENVGCGYTTSGASGMLGAWMQSSGHRGNILSSSFTDIGVGYYTDAKGMTWGVQVFAQYPKKAASSPKKPKASSSKKAAPKSTAPKPAAPKAAAGNAPADDAAQQPAAAPPPSAEAAAPIVLVPSTPVTTILLRTAPASQSRQLSLDPAAAAAPASAEAGPAEAERGGDSLFAAEGAVSGGLLALGSGLGLLGLIRMPRLISRERAGAAARTADRP